jgi:serine/threonine protein phosphatase PrpC
MDLSSSIRVGCQTHPGMQRENNEDCVLAEPAIGLFGVFDGMGGHQAGEVASQMARDTVLEVMRGAGAGDLRAAIERAFQAASKAVHDESHRRKARKGLGTTGVLCQLVGEQRAVVAHVGDSRAYLLREGRLRQLTTDHTVVAELVAKGALRADEVSRHPYASVLSRNIGSKPVTQVDVQDVELAVGDCLLLCSDGLSGFADHRAIEQMLTGAADPERAAADLIDLALRGGGGDNVSVVVIGVGRAVVPRTTQIVQTTGAHAWLERRAAFVAEATRRGLAQSPLCTTMAPTHTSGHVVDSMFDAIYRDLEHTTGIHVWTYADKLATGWLDEGGDYTSLRTALEILTAAAEAVVADVLRSDPHCGSLLRSAVPRALVVAHMAVGSMLAQRLRDEEGRIAAAQAYAVQLNHGPTRRMPAVRVDPPSPEVASFLDQAYAAVKREIAAYTDPPVRDLALDVTAWAHEATTETAGGSDAGQIAGQLFVAHFRNVHEFEPLLDAFDVARRFHVGALQNGQGAPELKASALRRVANAHRMLLTALAGLLVGAARPVSEKLAQTSELVAQLRRQVEANEVTISRLRTKSFAVPGWAGPEEDA